MRYRLYCDPAGTILAICVLLPIAQFKPIKSDLLLVNFIWQLNRNMCLNTSCFNRGVFIWYDFYRSNGPIFQTKYLLNLSNRMRTSWKCTTSVVSQSKWILRVSVVPIICRPPTKDYKSYNFIKCLFLNQCYIFKCFQFEEWILRS